jgi:hypothetical protein
VSLAFDFDVSIDSVMNGSFGGDGPAARICAHGRSALG